MHVTTFSEFRAAADRALAAGEHRFTVSGFREYGDRGGDRGPGLWVAVRVWVRPRKEWSVVKIEDDDTVTLSRDPDDKPQPPSDVRRAITYLGVKLGEMWRGRRLVPQDVFEARLDCCLVCPYRNDTVCSKCGCHLDKIPDDAPVEAGTPGKLHRAVQECPVGRWHQWQLPRPTKSS